MNFKRKETDIMEKQDKQEINNPQPVIEDLTVNEEQAAEVKAGHKHWINVEPVNQGGHKAGGG
jgi:hypothetical protein